jgi:hypothetical protein
MKDDKTIETQPDKDKNKTKDPSQPIEKPEEVPASNDEKIDQDFPGYPHYPAKDDILNPDNKFTRVDADVENLTRAHKIPAENLSQPKGNAGNVDGAFPLASPDDEDDEIGIVPGTEADVTKEDLLLLGDPDKDMDMDEDEAVLTNREWPLEMTGEDLDVPEADLDDENDALGQGDEENSYYSIGGDNHENLEEDNQNTY